MSMEDPLDFESEDQLLSSPVSTKKRRKKVIFLDDLLTDYYKERSKIVKKKSPIVPKCNNSDDDDDSTRKNKEAILSKFVDDCQKQVHEMVTEDEIPLWGQRAFGNQKSLPSVAFTSLGSCTILQSFMRDDLNIMLELDAENGETFLNGLLINGWLTKLVLKHGHVEDSMASWIFKLMLYSSDKALQDSACDFWCAIIQSKDEVDLPSVRFDWIPSYVELKEALHVYGYLLDSSYNISSHSRMLHTDSGSEGPPLNIISWIKFLNVCCQVRSILPIFSVAEVEEFLGVIMYLFLDRQLQGLSWILNKCMLSIIDFFTENEWNISSANVAKSIAHSIPKDLNCLRFVDCISGINIRSKHLRSEVALQILINCFDNKVTDAKEVLKMLMSINLKDKDCNFFQMYIYLVLADNWLFSHPALEDRLELNEMWGIYLRNCSCQITSTDWRSYASKVRNKASYLLQSTVQKEL